MIPFISFFEDSFKTRFIFFASTGFFNSKIKSVKDPSRIGTLIAKAFTLPFSSGKTLITASEAPVVVGIILSAAALPLRTFLFEESTRLWLEVYE